MAVISNQKQVLKNAFLYSLFCNRQIAELGSRDDCRDNVIMFYGLTIVACCLLDIYVLYSTLWHLSFGPEAVQFVVMSQKT